MYTSGCASVRRAVRFLHDCQNNPAFELLLDLPRVCAQPAIFCSSRQCGEVSPIYHTCKGKNKPHMAVFLFKKSGVLSVALTTPSVVLLTLLTIATVCVTC